MKFGTSKQVLFHLAAALTCCLGSAAWSDSQKFEITGNADEGEKVFRKCRACHQVGADAESGVGPVLNGILGRQAGTYEDFSYSKALTEKAAAEKLIWAPETLDAFLTKPKEFIDGTKMTFVGLRAEEDRANVIAYLATFKE